MTNSRIADDAEFEEFIFAIKSGAQERVENMLKVFRSDITNRIEPKFKQPSLYFAVVAPGDDIAVNILTLLLNAGADPFFKDQNEQTAMFYACRDGRDVIIDKLLKAGLSLDQVDTYGQTPLFYVASENRLNIVDKFSRSQMNHTDKLAGQTALYYAAKKGHLQMCRKLINYGIDVSILDNLGKTAAQYAKKAKFTEVAEYLGQQLKRNKEILRNQSQSNVEQSTQRKKKKDDNPKQVKMSYKIVHMNEKCETHDLTQEQLRHLLKDTPQKLQYFLHPDRIPAEQLQEAQGQTWIKIATKILNVCFKLKGAGWFTEPVNPVSYNIMDYYDIISCPMDLGTIRKKLQHNCYRSAAHFKQDMELVWSNCYKYNGEVHQISQCARQMQKYFTQAIKDTNFEQYL